MRNSIKLIMLLTLSLLFTSCSSNKILSTPEPTLQEEVSVNDNKLDDKNEEPSDKDISDEAKDEPKKEEPVKSEFDDSKEPEKGDTYSPTIHIDPSFKNITIVIDPGHSSVGNPEQEPVSKNSTQTKAKDVIGACGNYSKVYEYQINNDIGLLLRDNLKQMGFNVVMTKEDTSVSMSNIERANVGNNNNADLVIRLHADGSENNSINGASILTPSKESSSIYEKSNFYSSVIIDTYCSELNFKNRGIIYRNDLTGFNWSEVPVVLLEMGFLSNQDDDLFLSNPSNHKAIADAISLGISKCFK